MNFSNTIYFLVLVINVFFTPTHANPGMEYGIIFQKNLSTYPEAVQKCNSEQSNLLKIQNATAANALASEIVFNHWHSQTPLPWTESIWIENNKTFWSENGLSSGSHAFLMVVSAPNTSNNKKSDFNIIFTVTRIKTKRSERHNFACQKLRNYLSNSACEPDSIAPSASSSPAASNNDVKSLVENLKEMLQEVGCASLFVQLTPTSTIDCFISYAFADGCLESSCRPNEKCFSHATGFACIEEICCNSTFRNYKFPSTHVSTVAHSLQKCDQVNVKGTASVTCSFVPPLDGAEVNSSNFVFNEDSFNNVSCHTTVNDIVQELEDGLESISKTGEAIRKIQVVVSRRTNSDYKEIKESFEALKLIKDVIKKNDDKISGKVFASVVEAVSTVITVTTNRSSTREIGDNIFKVMGTFLTYLTSGNGHVDFNSENIFVEMATILEDDSSLVKTGTTLSPLVRMSDGSLQKVVDVTFDGSAIEKAFNEMEGSLQKPKELSIALILYKNDDLFQPPQPHRSKRSKRRKREVSVENATEANFKNSIPHVINQRVYQATFVKLGPQISVTGLEEPFIEINFKKKVSYGNETSYSSSSMVQVKETKCVHRNLSSGDWGDEGCCLHLMEDGRPQCACSVQGNIALLETDYVVHVDMKPMEQKCSVYHTIYPADINECDSDPCEHPKRCFDLKDGHICTEGFNRTLPFLTQIWNAIAIHQILSVNFTSWSAKLFSLYLFVIEICDTFVNGTFTFGPTKVDEIGLSLGTCDEQNIVSTSSMLCIKTSSKDTQSPPQYLFDPDSFISVGCNISVENLTENFQLNNIDNVERQTDLLQVVTSRKSNLTSSEKRRISSYISRLSQFVDKQNSEISANLFTNVVQVASKLLDGINAFSKPTKADNKADDVALALEKLLDRVDSGDEEIIFQSKNIYLQISPILENSTTFEEGISYTPRIYDPVENVTKPLEIKFPLQTIQQAREKHIERQHTLMTSNKTKKAPTPLTIGFLVYRNDAFFKSPKPVSKVVSIKLGRNISLDNLDPPITINYNEHRVVFGKDPSTRNSETGVVSEVQFHDKQCVFWNFTIQDWSSVGCCLKGKRKVSACMCNHLTNFALLLTVYDVPSDVSLNVFSNIGCVISIISLAIVIVLHLLHPNFKTKTSTKIQVHIYSNALIAYIIFLTGIEFALGNNFACSAVAMALHFFLLASFFWMGVYSINIYRSFLKDYMKKCCAVAYGIPLLLVVLNAAITLGYFDSDFKTTRFCFPVEETGLRKRSYYIAENMCWLTTPSIYVFLGIVGMILLNNTIVLIHIGNTVLFKKQKIRSTAKKSKLRQIKIAFTMSLTLGLSWIVGYFLLITPNRTYQKILGYAFACITTAQAVAILYLTCIRRTAMFAFWYEPLLRLFKSPSGVQETQSTQSSSEQHPAKTLRGNISTLHK